MMTPAMRAQRAAARAPDKAAEAAAGVDATVRAAATSASYSQAGASGSDERQRAKTGFSMTGAAVSADALKAAKNRRKTAGAFNRREDWDVLKNEHDQPYYFNKVTGVTTWDKPKVLSGPEDWTMQTDDAGQVFYYNTCTLATTWTRPEELEPLEETVKVIKGGAALYYQRQDAKTEQVLEGFKVLWYEIQENVFRRWVNKHLEQRGETVWDLRRDLKDGRRLLVLLEVLMEKEQGTFVLHAHPVVMSQKVYNNRKALEIMEANGMRLPGATGDDIYEGNLKVILNCIWVLIVNYEFKRPELATSPLGLRKEMLNYFMDKIEGKLHGKTLTNLQKDWNSGIFMCHAVDAHRPPYLSPVPQTTEDATKGSLRDRFFTCKRVIEWAHKELGVRPLLTAGELLHPKIPEICIMVYLAQFWNVDKKVAAKPWPKYGLAFALGPGLQEGHVGRSSSFDLMLHAKVTSSKKDIVTVRVFGPGWTRPKGKHEFTAQERKDRMLMHRHDLTVSKAEKFALKLTKEVKEAKFESGETVVGYSYTPTDVGVHYVRITIKDKQPDGKEIVDDIPGSPFKVTVMPKRSLGGEGRVWCFYSTSPGTALAKNHTANMKTLLSIKKAILKRHGHRFEWHPMDVMDKEDRDYVYDVAGLKRLPLVWCDEDLVGTFETVQMLNETGKLDDVFRVGHKKGMCESCEAVHAQQWCVGCREELCRPCASAHNEELEAQSLEPHVLKRTPVPYSPGKLCDRCFSNLATIHCEGCRHKELCGKCSMSRHSEGHAKYHVRYPIADCITKGVVCDECTGKDALIFCPECNKSLCAVCVQTTHETGEARAHVTEPLTPALCVDFCRQWCKRLVQLDEDLTAEDEQVVDAATFEMMPLLPFKNALFNMYTLWIEMLQMNEAPTEADKLQIVALLEEQEQLEDIGADELETGTLDVAADDVEEVQVEAAVATDVDVAVLVERAKPKDAGAEVFDVSDLSTRLDGTQDDDDEESSQSDAFFFAVWGGNVQKIGGLLDAGFQIDSLDEEGKSGLDYAVARELPPVTEFLLSRGARPAAVSAEALFTAIEKGSVKGLECLVPCVLKAGRTLEEPNPAGHTPLMAAYEADQMMCARYLLSKGAQPVCALCLQLPAEGTSIAAADEEWFCDPCLDEVGSDSEEE